MDTIVIRHGHSLFISGVIQKGLCYHDPIEQNIKECAYEEWTMAVFMYLAAKRRHLTTEGTHASSAGPSEAVVAASSVAIFAKWAPSLDEESGG